MLDEQTSAPPLRGEDGAIRADYVEQVAAAISRSDTAVLRDLVGDLHEADVGALLEALEPEQRPRLVELLGLHFDFAALTEVDDSVRDEILEELPPATVAEGVRDLESDDAVAISPASNRRTAPRSSTSCRRPSGSRLPAAWNIRRSPLAGGCKPISSSCRQPGPSAAP